MTDLQPHLRGAIAKVNRADAASLSAAIDELQRLVEDYRELEKLTNAPLRGSYPLHRELGAKIDPSQLAESAAVQERQRLGPATNR